jgi:hypothetical protein
VPLPNAAGPEAGLPVNVPGDKTLYQAYLLRVWRESPTSPRRASLQDALTGERYLFADLVELMVFLTEKGPEVAPWDDSSDTAVG